MNNSKKTIYFGFNLSENFSFGIGSSKWRIASTSKMAGQTITYNNLIIESLCQTCYENDENKKLNVQ